MSVSDPALVERLAARIAQGASAKRSFIAGLSGPQGSGKSTLAAALALALQARGLHTATLSLDDLYLGRAARARLAREVHPLFATRGPPGTHDVALGLRTLDVLARPGPIPLPRFDKAVDDRGPDAPFDGPADVVLFEGWCLGARPQGEAALLTPANALERDEDTDGRWRRAVDAALAGPYAALFARIDLLVLLLAPGFGVVRGWRGEAERALAADVARGRPGRAMDDAELDRFLQHYERITRWVAADLPARADVVVALDAERRAVEVRGA